MAEPTAEERAREIARIYWFKEAIERAIAAALHAHAATEREAIERLITNVPHCPATGGPSAYERKYLVDAIRQRGGDRQWLN